LPIRQRRHVPYAYISATIIHRLAVKRVEERDEERSEERGEERGEERDEERNEERSEERRAGESD